MFMCRTHMIGLGDLNRYTGDGAKQKIKTVSAILLDNRMLTATLNFQAYRKKKHILKGHTYERIC